MLKEVIGVGDTELEALNDAKRQLGLDETDEVEFELIQRAEKKKFGLFGGSPAKVKIIIKDTPEEKAGKFLKEGLDKMMLS
ncbi:MAG TPA: single-stranded DNA-binding protein, partial [Ruminococcus sp.]|nr:single-stranded DNA-binding protein [Ruminococcus sp.]